MIIEQVSIYPTDFHFSLLYARVGHRWNSKTYFNKVKQADIVFFQYSNLTQESNSAQTATTKEIPQV